MVWGSREHEELSLRRKSCHLMMVLTLVYPIDRRVNSRLARGDMVYVLIIQPIKASRVKFTGWHILLSFPHEGGCQFRAGSPSSPV